jgi:ribosomal protein L11 methyltransferase
LIRLAVRVHRDRAELVLAELLELAPGGVEEATLPDGTVEYAVYGAPGELPALPALTAAAGGALVEVRTDQVADDWDRRWRRFHKPLVLGDRLTVRPPWEPPTGRTALDVVIDPGRAFGTGAHPTTRLCLELLLALEPTGSLIDLGCGSGVLAITAAMLGFRPVLARDNDQAAVDASLQNARRNHVEIDVERFDLRVDSLPEATTVVANLVESLLLALAPRLPAGVKHLIASGLLPQEADPVAAAFGRRGMPLSERRDEDGWTALLLG